MPATPANTCLEEGPQHSYRRTGLDVVKLSGRDTLCQTRHCVWCGNQQVRKHSKPPGAWRALPTNKKE